MALPEQDTPTENFNKFLKDIDMFLDFLKLENDSNPELYMDTLAEIWPNKSEVYRFGKDELQTYLLKEKLIPTEADVNDFTEVLFNWFRS
jgi:hypothetical protein